MKPLQVDRYGYRRTYNTASGRKRNHASTLYGISTKGGTMEILAQRELPGWPGVTVRIEWDRKTDNCTVIVTDPSGDTVIHEGQFVDGGRARARDCYFHPFVFGYHGANLAGVS